MTERDPGDVTRLVTAAMSLMLRKIVFTLVVPGLGGVWVPWRILTRTDATVEPVAWHAVVLIVAGASLYFSCLRAFALVGKGTPGPWDAPRRFVAAGPYPWVRNPMYIAALLVVGGEAWLFRSLPLLAYAGVMGIFFHGYVICSEEPGLRRRFGDSYEEYRQAVWRWVPRRPRVG